MQKPRVSLQKCRHRDAEVIKIGFEKNDEILNRLRQVPGVRWSQTLRSWYAPNRTTLVNELFAVLKAGAFIDYSLLKESGNSGAEDAAAKNTVRETDLPGPLKNLNALSEEQTQKIKGFESWMRSRRYSDSTVGTYTDALGVFLRYFGSKTLEHINNADLVQFNNEYILANRLSASYQNQVVNAVKLFFRTIELRSMDVELIHRPKRAKLLPNVLSKEEVKLILNALNNIKHKAMLSLIYACGLRCGELLRLKPEHIDEKRRLLIVKQAKGRKDRIVPLSDKVVILLREHMKIQDSVNYLFEGQTKGQMYDDRSLQQVLKNAVAKAGIRKPVTLHWLRHSYATHLLESGTDLRYIQEILGHRSSKTTEIYTHVSNNSIQKIISPFDNL